MDKDVYIFVGRSGCGKGTQKDLLIKKLQSLNTPYLSMYVGDFLREFQNTDSDVAKRIKIGMDRGTLAPSFVAVSSWGNVLMRDYKEGQSLIFDGTPRTLAEAYVLESAFDFLDFVHPIVIHLNVSNKWSKDRLLARGRKDDTEIEIEERLTWFETNVTPVINYFRGRTSYQFIEVNGEQTIDQVASDIMRQLPFLNKAPNSSTIARSYGYVSSSEAVNMPQNVNKNQNISGNQNP